MPLTALSDSAASFPLGACSLVRVLARFKPEPSGFFNSPGAFAAAADGVSLSGDVSLGVALADRPFPFVNASCEESIVSMAGPGPPLTLPLGKVVSKCALLCDMLEVPASRVTGLRAVSAITLAEQEEEQDRHR